MTKAYGTVRKKKPGAVKVYYNITSYTIPFAHNRWRQPSSRLSWLASILRLL